MQSFSGELQRFTQKERDLLIKHNVPVPNILIKEGLPALENIKQGKDAPHTLIKKSLEILRDETCKLQATLEKETPEAKKRELVKKVLVKTVIAGSACVVAIVNVMAEQDGTLTPAEATLSGHIAAGIIGAAATDVMNFMASLAS
ncbi:MAG: hypothetical protein KJ077_05515 [Anaerolineae bacterium]|nr:hypothetical protein [Anaerolineae bacterium]